MIVYVDMDGVVADFVGGAMRIHDRKWPFSEDNCGDKAWNIVSTWDMTEHNFYKPMGYRFWLELEKTAEADLLMAILSESFGPENICFLTTPANVHGCMEGKRDWVAHHFPQFPVMLAVPHYHGHMPKEHFAHGRAILIDDHTPNVQRFTMAGGYGVLFPRPWNAAHAMHGQWKDHVLSFVEALGGKNGK